MSQYAIIDVGSNTVVLVIYQYQNETIKTLHTTSRALRLVNDIENKHMQKRGLDKLSTTIQEYLQIASSYDLQDTICTITACGRNIDNPCDMIDTVKACGVEKVHILTGEQEALCDYYGTCVDTSLQDGLLIDIGGGSTEFVAFKDNTITALASIPLGCVRLSHLEKSPKPSLDALKALQQSNPSFGFYPNAIGVGGTIRAARNTLQEIHPVSPVFTKEELFELYDGVLNNDERFMKAILKHVEKERQEVFVFGLGMLVAASQHFQIERFYTSEFGVREGVLKVFALKQCSL